MLARLTIFVRGKLLFAAVFASACSSLSVRALLCGHALDCPESLSFAKHRCVVQSDWLCMRIVHVVGAAFDVCTLPISVQRRGYSLVEVLFESRCGSCSFRAQ